MPAKSRHRGGKRLSQGKGRKSRQRSSTEVSQQPITAQTGGPVSGAGASAPPVSVPTPRAKPAVVRYPYITSELLTIGILAGLMLVILIVLALVLS